jgi:hypothetical protein
MISLQQKTTMFKNKSFNFSYVSWRDVDALCQHDWIQPKFAFAIAGINMYMRKLFTFIGLEMKSKCAYAQNGWHPGCYLLSVVGVYARLAGIVAAHDLWHGKCCIARLFGSPGRRAMGLLGYWEAQSLAWSSGV